MVDTTEILSEVKGRLGIVTLNRPNALNALNLAMIRSLHQAFDRFEADQAIDAIAIQAVARSRAFCAGGDVRSLVLGPPDAADALRREFFAEEYRLNYRIHTCPKPVIALMDGITMGGGCGLSMHASHRVSTERTMMAMPETVLGFFPDVGATWFLSRLSGHMGLYLGLTGARLQAADLGRLGLATHHIAAASVAAVAAALAAEPRLDGATADAVLARHAAEPDRAGLDVATRTERIDALFGGATVSAVITALADATEPWVGIARTALERASPTSLTVTFHQLRSSGGASFAEMMRIEYRLAVRLTARPDFAEGVRAILIDKTNDPTWHPATLAAVEPALIDDLFAPFASPDAELDLARYG